MTGSQRRVDLAQWSRIEWAGQTVYLADRPSLAGQGLAGVQPDTFGENDTVYFLSARAEWGDFDNRDYGFGVVAFDIEIAFLDGSGNVLAIEPIPAETGRAAPPRETQQAIEAKPGWFARMGFDVGRPSPVVVRFRPHRSGDPNDCYAALCRRT